MMPPNVSIQWSDEGESSKRPYYTISGTTEPLASPTLLGRTPHGKAIFLPAGVSDVEGCGRSVIQFGKYMNKRGTPGVSYEELFAGRLIEEEKRTYVSLGDEPSRFRQGSPFRFRFVISVSALMSALRRISFQWSLAPG